MATLIPALATCTARMSSGERRLARFLEEKLDEDYLLWYDVPVGPLNAHPDFVVLHPSRGVLILEVKDWKLSTIRQVDRERWEILADGVVKSVTNPLEQAREYAHKVVDALARDPQLRHAEGPYAGALALPWSYGVVLSNITREEFDLNELRNVVEPHRVVCKDEMSQDIDAEGFQTRLWGMFPRAMRGMMTLPQLDRVRWIMFPQIRVPTQGELFDDSDANAELPDIMRVMDLEQEQLARSLGAGHRVIHGVAGSGKTMILGYRAEYLARGSTKSSKPILVLCFNEPLAVKLLRHMAIKGLSDRVVVRHFHKWCREQLVTFGQSPPEEGPRFFEDMVNRLISAVDRGQVPKAQYQAILIDEGHDFAPEWLKLVTQMVDPLTNSILLLYDDAQSIYERSRNKQFSFRSVGIEAQGRTRILKINYRNTKQILQTANLIAADLLLAEDNDDDGIPVVAPISAGREGAEPIILRFPTLRDEAYGIADRLSQAHQEGHAWSDMAVLCPDGKLRDLCAQALAQRSLPVENRLRPGDFDPVSDKIKVMTMHVSKGLEFPVVALPGVGHMPAIDGDENDAARLFYVAATRATERLIVTMSGDSAVGRKLRNTGPDGR